MKCSNCGNIVKRGDVYCSNCRAKLIWKEPEQQATSLAYTGKETEEEVLSEGKKQLGGIVILLWVLIGMGSLGLIIAFFTSCATMFEEDFYAGLGSLILALILYGVTLLLFIFAQLGIRNRKPYTVPLVRTILVIGCFNLVGLILVLVIFWRRINNSFSKRYLNYFDGTY